MPTAILIAFAMGLSTTLWSTVLLGVQTYNWLTAPIADSPQAAAPTVIAVALQWLFSGFSLAVLYGLF